MRVRAAVAYSANQPMVIEEVDLDPPGDGQVLVRYSAAGLCHSDLHVLDGSRAGRFPLILGHEAAGEVVECGPGVSRLSPGDRILPFAIPHCGACEMCQSGRTNLCRLFFAPPEGGRFTVRGQRLQPFLNIAAFAEYAVVPEIYLARVRPDAPAKSICCIGCGVATGVGAALYSAKVHKDSTVVVLGLGGIGLSAVQGAKIAGASRIIGVDTNPAKEAPGRQLGMTDFVNASALNGGLTEHIVAMTSGGADFAFECVGNPSLMTTALECTKPGWGTGVIVGLAADGQLMSLSPSNMTRGRRLIGTMMGGVSAHKELPMLIDWYMEGRLKVDEIVSHVLPLEQINEGFELLRSGQALRAVVTFD